MSRIGRMPITVPAGVTVTFDNNLVTVKGPKGTLTNEFHKDMIFENQKAKASLCEMPPLS